jgi:hypothetical protein
LVAAGFSLRQHRRDACATKNIFDQKHHVMQSNREKLTPAASTPPHGGGVYDLARRLGVKVHDLLDFSANINPLGFPPGLTPAVLKALEEIVHYPDRQCLALRRDLAAYHGLSPEQILVGNGSTELIFLLARALAPRKGLIVAPAFSEYEAALSAARVPVEFHLSGEADNFTLDGALDPRGADLVFLANPASPSGALLPEQRLLAALKTVEAAGAYLALDEAFVDFVEEASLSPSFSASRGCAWVTSWRRRNSSNVWPEPRSPGRWAPWPRPWGGPAWRTGSLWPAAGSWCRRNGNISLIACPPCPGCSPSPARSTTCW